MIGRLARSLWPRLDHRQRLMVFSSAACMACSKVAALSVPWLFGRAVDAVAVQTGPVFAVISGLLLSYVAMGLIGNLLGELRNILFIRVSEHQIRLLALDVFRHLHRLSLSFHLDRQTGGMARAIDRGAKSIQFMLSSVLYNMLPTAIELIAMCLIFWALFGWEYCVVVTIAISVYVAFTFMVSSWRIQFRRQLNAADEKTGTQAVDSLINHETVKLLAAEEREAELYDQSLAAYEKASITAQQSLCGLNIGQYLVLAAGLGSVLLLAARDSAAGSFSPGDLATVNSYLIQLFLPLNFLGTVYRLIVQSITDMERLFNLLDEPLTVADPKGSGPLPSGPGQINFEAVSLALGGRQILTGLDLNIQAGQRVALVGETGAGKTTVTRLLARLIDPNAGRILIDGVDVRSVQQRSVRAAIGFVPQDTVMFNASLRFNLSYAEPNASDHDLDQALATAGLENFVEALPEGLETIVGERGLKLSGGERQRLAIARALLRQPRILVLDEATSALDAPTERRIKDAINRASAGRTALIIAHRLATVMDCDRILFLANGSVIEAGTHAELIELGGRYAEAWRIQSKHPQNPKPAATTTTPPIRSAAAAAASLSAIPPEPVAD